MVQCSFKQCFFVIVGNGSVWNACLIDFCKTQPSENYDSCFLFHAGKDSGNIENDDDAQFSMRLA